MIDTRPYEELAQEIIVQAVEDKAQALYKKYLAEKMLAKANETIEEVDALFNGQKLQALTDYSVQRLNFAAEWKGKYKLFAHEHGCNRCEHTAKECPWRTEKNFVAFSKVKHPDCPFNKISKYNKE